MVNTNFKKYYSNQEQFRITEFTYRQTICLETISLNGKKVSTIEIDGKIENFFIKVIIYLSF